MFWNDPNLYGATLPHKDFPVQTPFGFTPFDQFRRVIPQPIGYMPQFPYLQQPQGWLPQTQGWPPQAQGWLPPTYGFVPPYLNVPQTFDPMFFQRNINPWMQPLGYQPPLYNIYRPMI